MTAMQTAFDPHAVLQQRITANDELKALMRRLEADSRVILIAENALTHLASYELEWDAKFKEVMLGQGFKLKIKLRDKDLEFAVKMNGAAELSNACHYLAPDIKRVLENLLNSS